MAITYNNVPTTGSWGASADVTNDNFLKTGTELARIDESISNITTRFKGYFPTLPALQTAFPLPKIGDTAWVGTPYPGYIHICEVAGAWEATTQVPPTPPVDLSPYAKTTTPAGTVVRTPDGNIVNFSGLYYTETIYPDLDAKTCSVAAGYFFDGTTNIAVAAHNIIWTTTNLQYMYFSRSTSKFYIQDHSVPRLSANDVLYGVIDLNGHTTNLGGRNVDLGKYEPIYKTGLISGSTSVLYLDFNSNGGFKLRNTAGFVGSNQGSTYVTLNEGEIDFPNPVKGHYVYFDTDTRNIECFAYDAKPSKQFKNMWFLGYINPVSKKFKLEAFNVVLNGDAVDTFKKSQSDIIASAKVQLGDTVLKHLPSADWINKIWNNTLGTDGIFFDRRCIISEYSRLKNIRINLATAGLIKVHLLDMKFNILRTEDFTLPIGSSDMSISNIDYSVPQYVGVQNVTGIVRTISPANNQGFGFKKLLSTGETLGNDYAYSYKIENEDFSRTLSGRVHNLENIYLPESDDLGKLLEQSDIVYLKPISYTLDATLKNLTGKTIIGVKGRTKILVPKELLLGLDLKGITNFVFRDCIVIGAYNGTPTKDGLQPVRSGVIQAYDQALNWVGAGYNTDMANGGVTAEYIPQIGLNMDACERIEITGCEFRNFSWAGIRSRLSGKSYRNGGMKIENNFIHDCYCGIHLYDESERAQFISNDINLNQIGMYVDSGTNMFVVNNCTANRVGLVLGNGWNHAHGVFSGNAFTHNSLFSIIAVDIENGQRFSECKIGYVDTEVGNAGYSMLIIRSRGINFLDGDFINAKIDINGVFSKHLIGKTIAPADQFGNERYILQFSDVTGQPSNYNGGINKLSGNQVQGDFDISLSGGASSSNLILKDNFYISGQDSSPLNN